MRDLGLPNDPSTIFEDSFVSSSVAGSLKELGVSTRIGLVLEEPKLSNGQVVGGVFRDVSSHEMVDFDFDMMLCADSKDVDLDIYSAANESGLVYDGRLVVDATFHTTDPPSLLVER